MLSFHQSSHTISSIQYCDPSYTGFPSLLPEQPPNTNVVSINSIQPLSFSYVSSTGSQQHSNPNQPSYSLNTQISISEDQNEHHAANGDEEAPEKSEQWYIEEVEFDRGHDCGRWVVGPGLFEADGRGDIAGRRKFQSDK